MKLTTKILIGLVIVLSALFFVTGKMWLKEKKERIRHEINESELTKNLDQSNMDLTLSRKDFAKMQTNWSNRVDSIVKVKDWKIKQITELYSMEIAYHDSVNKLAQMGTPEPIKQPNSKVLPKSTAVNRQAFKIPFTQADSCMFVKGIIISTDPTSKVKITDKGFKSVGDLFAKRKRALGFLWWQKPTEYYSVSNCGEMKYTHIKFFK